MVGFDSKSIVLYEDEAILVVNKPFGLLSIQDGYDITLPHISTVLEPDFGPIWMVHRLDRDTSGVLVLARNQEAHRNLNRQFQNRQVVKTYHAIILGSPTWQSQRANFPLRMDGDRRHRTVVDEKRGKTAVTDFSVLGKYGKWSLLEAYPFTGYTHQIRAHLAHLGFPIAVDPLYGDGKSIILHLPQENSTQPQAILSRLGLHAYSLVFSHPMSLEKVSFIAPYPDDFKKTIELLQQ